VTGSTVPVRIAVRNLTINCAWAGKAPRAGMGHWHLLLDGGLVNMECATAAVLSMQNVAPGKHTITALLAADDHTAIKGPDTSATTTLTYKPAHSLPTIKPYKASGKPRITILAPRSGATVGEHFQVVLGWQSFRLSCALLGKPNVPGYGHWHLFIDTLKKGLATMVAMGCTHTYTVFTDGLAAGKHTLYAVLTDNLHAPITPSEVASITLNVKTGTTSSTGSHTTSRWLAWNAATHTATLTLIANYNNTLGGFNFNGYGDGKMAITVPVGAHVDVHFSNKGSIPHSAFITPWSDRTSTSGFATAFKGASTANPTSGTTAGTTQTFSFVASKAGKYALVCAVPGHETAGMWDVFMVTSGGTPSVTVH
jgi:sulfocyanin